MSVWGLPNVLRILDDIDKGKLQRYTFIECHACFEGCVSGALTVENLRRPGPGPAPAAVAAEARSGRSARLRAATDGASSGFDGSPAPARPLGRDIVTAITRMQERDRVAASLPASTAAHADRPCAAFAEDVDGRGRVSSAVLRRRSWRSNWRAWRLTCLPHGTSAGRRSGDDRH
jgi:hypothetical protein